MKKIAIIPCALSVLLLTSCLFDSPGYSYHDRDYTDIVESSYSYGSFFDFNGNANLGAPTIVSNSYFEDLQFPKYDGVNYSRFCYIARGDTVDIYLLGDTITSRSYLTTVPYSDEPIHIYDDMPFAAIDLGDNYALYTTTGVDLGVTFENLSDVSISITNSYTINAQIINHDDPGPEDDYYLKTKSNINSNSGFPIYYELTKSSYEDASLTDFIYSNDYISMKYTDNIDRQNRVVYQNGVAIFYDDDGNKKEYEILSTDCFSQKLLDCENVQYLVLPTKKALCVLATGNDTKLGIVRSEMFVLNDDGKTNLRQYVPVTFNSLDANVSYSYHKPTWWHVAHKSLASSSFIGFKLKSDGTVDEENSYTFTITGSGNIKSFLNSSSEDGEETDGETEEISPNSLNTYYSVSCAGEGNMIGINDVTGDGLLFYRNGKKQSFFSRPDYILESKPLSNGFASIETYSEQNFVYKDKIGYYHYVNESSDDIIGDLSTRYVGVTRFDTYNSKDNLLAAVETSSDEIKVTSKVSSTNEKFENARFSRKFMDAFNQCSLLLDTTGIILYTGYSFSRNRGLNLDTSVKNIEFLTRTNLAQFYYKVTHTNGNISYISIKN